MPPTTPTDLDQWIIQRLRSRPCPPEKLIRAMPAAELGLLRLERAGVIERRANAVALVKDEATRTREEELILRAMLDVGLPVSHGKLTQLVLGLRRPALSQGLRRLAAAGEIERVHTHDRAVHWRLSDAGKFRLSTSRP